MEELNKTELEEVISELRMINNYNSTLFSNWLFSFDKYFEVEEASFQMWKVRRIPGKFFLAVCAILCQLVYLSISPSANTFFAIFSVP